MIDIIFDQYQRYKNTQIIINSIRKKDEKLKILEVGANEHKNLEKFLPNDDITYLDISLPDELLNDPKYILGDATNMDFNDGEYDIVIALDVYEHIPKDLRKNFINELYRVSSKIAVISAPFNKIQVELAESRANIYHRALVGLEHRWLYEHINNGLPDIEELKKYLKDNNIKYSNFSHGKLDLWEKLTNIQALIEIDSGLEDYIVEIDKYYNALLFDKDYDVNGYRDFFIFEKGREFNLKFESSNEKLSMDYLLDNLYRLLESRRALNLINPVLPGRGDNIIRMYVDNGNGFNESNTMIKHLEITNLNHIVFDEFNGEKIKSIRIDPTENSGKYIFRDLIVKNSNDEIINNVVINSNSYIVENDIYIFLNKDPQILLEVNDEEIKSIEFTIKEIRDYKDDSQILQNTMMNKLENVIENQKSNAELIKTSTRSFYQKIKSKIK